jgi:hypothetical protein
MVFDKLVIWSWSGELSLKEVCGVTLNRREWFGNVFVLVCYFNGKWLKNLHVFCVSLLY